MITIFAVPKSFKDPHISMIQENAIRSWLNLPGKCEILLLGNEEGVADIARKLNIKHIPEVACNEFGTPLLNSVFDIAQQNSKYDILAYVNADVILMSDFIVAIYRIPLEKPFMLVGRRWNLDIKEHIDFTSGNWETELRSRVINYGILHGYHAIDYFVFLRNFWGELPPFAIGRIYYDNWLLYRARSLGAALIDATKVITIVHQNHHYNHLPQGHYIHGPEAKQNYILTGGSTHLFTIKDANKILTARGIRKAPLTLEPLRRYFTVASEKYPCYALLFKLGSILITPSRIVNRIRRMLRTEKLSK